MDPTTAPTMTGTFGPPPVLSSSPESPLSSLEFEDPVSSGSESSELWVEGAVLVAELGSVEVLLGNWRYTVRASGGKPSSSGQPINETDGEAEGDAS